MDWLSANGDVIFWTIAAIVLFVVEVFTVNTISICFAIGAVIAIIPALIGAPMWVQIPVFIIGSVATILTGRKYFIKKIKGIDITEKAKPEGKTAIVSQEIKPGIKGQIKMDGVCWTALAVDDDETIPEGTRVIVSRQEGTKCYVEKYESVSL